MPKDSFIFYRSFYEASKDLKDKDRAKLYDAICEKSLNDKDIQLTGISNSMFTLIKPQIEANNKKYENGKKGGRPKNKNQNETLGFENQKPKQNQNETTGFENDTKKENQNETEAKANVNAECIMNNENEECKMLNAECQKIVRAYEGNIGTIAPASAELLFSYLEDLPVEMIVQAIIIATLSNKKNTRYIQGILNDWIRKGYKTLADIQQEKKDVNSIDNTEKRVQEALNG